MKTKLYLALAIGLFAISRARCDEPPAIEPQAERILRNACHYLADSPSFMIQGEIWREKVVESGQKLQFSRVLEMNVRRPDHLHTELRSQFSHRGFWYDGKTFTVLDRKRNFYSTTEVAGTMDSALDQAHDDFGIDIPLVDLAFADPYASLTAKVQKGTYLGISVVLGVDCHHLSFIQDNIDWQVWITQGPQPVIRKLVLTHKLEPGAPQFSALLTHWDFNSKIGDFDFEFSPPEGASKIPMRKPDASQGADKTENAPAAQEPKTEEKK